MIPEFDDNGNLPPGVHWVEWEEFKERFGYNRGRRLLMDGLEMAMQDLQAAGCRVIYINGSFTTIKSDPIDFDACYDNETVDTNYLRVNAPRLFNHYDRAGMKTRYKGEIFPSNQQSR